MQNKSNSNSRTAAIDDIINEIKSKSADGDYIYRGERKKYPKISSALYREYAKVINMEGIGRIRFNVCRKRDVENR